MAQYIVAVGYVDNEDITLVEGPEVADWKFFCDSLIPVAARRALEEVSSKVEPTYLDWNDIVKELLEILKQKGYKVTGRHDLPGAVYHWVAIDTTYREIRKRPWAIQQMKLLGPLVKRIIQNNDAAKEHMGKKS